MNIRPVYRGMAAGAPAITEAQFRGVFFVADENAAGSRSRFGTHSLRVTFQAEVVVPFHQHLGVDGTVRVMTNDAAFAQRLVLIDEGFGLLAMAWRTSLIQPRHGQSSGWLADVHPVWIVALNAVHFALHHRVMLRKIEFGVGLQVTSETCRRLAPRIDNEFPAPAACGDVFAGGAVAGFAAA